MPDVHLPFKDEHFIDIHLPDWRFPGLDLEELNETEPGDSENLCELGHRVDNPAGDEQWGHAGSNNLLI